MYIPPQQIYPGGQAGVVVIQPSGVIASTSHGYLFAAGQQTVFLPSLVAIASSYQKTIM